MKPKAVPSQKPKRVRRKRLPKAVRDRLRAEYELRAEVAKMDAEVRRIARES